MTGVLVQLRADGKIYPPYPRTSAEIAAIRALEHGLRCVQHLSYRAVQSALLDQHEIRRSIGSVYRDLNRWTCPHCARVQRARPPAPPAPRVKAVPVPWR